MPRIATVPLAAMNVRNTLQDLMELPWNALLFVPVASPHHGER